MIEIPYDASALPQKGIAVIDGTPAHRQQAFEALDATYRVLEFGNTAQAISVLGRVAVDLIIVDEAVGPHECQELIRIIKAMPLHQKTAILVMYRGMRTNAAKYAEMIGADDYISKPYRRSELYHAVLSLINRFVEKEWEILPEIQRTALKKSLDVFSAITDALESGRDIPYSSLVDACSPLVEAVKRNDFKGMLDSVRKHDNYTYAHSLRVAAYMTMIGHTIGLRDKALHLIAGSGLMHDVGKQTIPHEILNKAGRFDPEEWEIMKGHALASGRCLARQQSIPKLVIDVAEQHHERIDGLGYPRGLSGAELHEITRMASITDVFSALTDRRAYKKAIEVPDALTMMSETMTGYFDKTLFTIFVKSLIQTEIIAATDVSGEVLAALGEHQ